MRDLHVLAVLTLLGVMNGLQGCQTTSDQKPEEKAIVTSKENSVEPDIKRILAGGGLDPRSPNGPKIADAGSLRQGNVTAYSNGEQSGSIPGVKPVSGKTKALPAALMASITPVEPLKPAPITPVSVASVPPLGKSEFGSIGDFTRPAAFVPTPIIPKPDISQEQRHDVPRMRIIDITKKQNPNQEKRNTEKESVSIEPIYIPKVKRF